VTTFVSAAPPASPSRPVGTAALVIAIVAVVFSASSTVLSFLLPLLTESLSVGTAAIVATFNGFDILTAVVALVAIVLGVASVVRAPRSLRGGFAIGAGVVIFVGILVGQLSAVILSASVVR
jgi:hypothetical protein